MTAVTDQPTLLVNNLVRGTQEVTRLVITVPSDGFLQGHHIGLQGLQTAAQRRLAPSQLPCWAYRFNDRARGRFPALIGDQAKPLLEHRTCPAVHCRTDEYDWTQ